MYVYMIVNYLKTRINNILFNNTNSDKEKENTNVSITNKTEDCGFNYVSEDSLVLPDGGLDMSKLPSDNFVLDEKYQKLDSMDSKIKLQERTKELNAIKVTVNNFSNLNGPTKDIVQPYVNKLNQWFQYPNVTESKITIGSNSFKSNNYYNKKDSLDYSESTNIGTEIQMSIIYTDERPVEDIGPWLDEEKELIKNLVNIILNYHFRWEDKQRREKEIDDKRNKTQKLKRGLDNFTKQVEEISQSTNEINSEAEETSDNILEISNEISQMSAIVEEIASTSEEVSMMSEEANELSKDGESSAEVAKEMMIDIESATEDVSEDFYELQDKIDEIEEMVTVINKISDKTNLLALNASIEAARAGDAGSGFAVVADEVKTLAEDSKEHVNEIEQLTENITTGFNQTVESLDETINKVEHGKEEVDVVLDNLRDISNAVEESSQGIKEVSKATDEQAASTEEIAATIDSVVDMSENVSKEIDEIARRNNEQVSNIEELSETVSELE